MPVAHGSPISVALAVVAVICLHASAPAARAAERPCVGTLSNTSVNGDVVVPAGATCRLKDVAVGGTVRVHSNAALQILGGAAIRGSVEAYECAYVVLDPQAPGDRIAVAGNIEIEHCTEASGKLFSAGRVAIAGNFSCRNNAAPCFAVSLTVGGDMVIERNSGGMSYIEGNTIGGSLECAGNWGLTDYGDPNTVGGKRRDGCAGLSD